MSALRPVEQPKQRKTAYICLLTNNTMLYLNQNIPGFIFLTLFWPQSVNSKLMITSCSLMVICHGAPPRFQGFHVDVPPTFQGTLEPMDGYPSLVSWDNFPHLRVWPMLVFVQLAHFRCICQSASGNSNFPLIKTWWLVFKEILPPLLVICIP